MASCYLESLNYVLASTVFQGVRSKLDTEVSLSGRNCLLIEISGFLEHFISFVSTIWDIFRAFSCPSADLFLLCKQRASLNLRTKLTEPASLTNFILAEHTCKSIYAVDTMLEELNSLVFDDFSQFMSSIGTKLSVEGLLCGDLSREEADEVCEMISVIETSPLIASKDGRRDDIPLPDHDMNVCARKISDTNFVANVCYQIGEKRHIAMDTALLRLFSSFIENDIVLKLRYQKNLGYAVSAQTDDEGKIIYSFCVVSCDYNHEVLLANIEEYVRSVRLFLESVDSSVFEKHKAGIQFFGEVESLWEQLSEEDRSDDFEMSVKNCMKDISKDDVIKFYTKWFLPPARPFAICIWGCQFREEYWNSK
ncbi:unnamed protein product [Eruca vesicaria subsp. sativa]|uniref:Uncharacterized protein n=1 Tax=Eruca vesicaria subsp. sativa TaxID=29727 RepID=A0ABC8KQ67_ERUVS|nr:unnamed protein product [Eruca vesicaria subsp. sativa]